MINRYTVTYSEIERETETETAIESDRVREIEVRETEKEKWKEETEKEKERERETMRQRQQDRVRERGKRGERETERVEHLHFLLTSLSLTPCLLFSRIPSPVPPLSYAHGPAHCIAHYLEYIIFLLLPYFLSITCTSIATCC